jgi:CSLREA domain-containing protein
MMKMLARTATHPLKMLAAVGVALLLWGLLLAYGASPAQAATITVNSLADGTDGTDGECTLREAITAANTDTASGAAAGECSAGSGDDVIDMGVTGTVNLTGALPDLSSNLKIEGPGADKFTVRRDTGGDYGIFLVRRGSVVSISGITIANGKSDFGGGVFNDGGDLTITSSTVSDNSATGGFGGGIVNWGGTLKITGSTVSGNSAPSGNAGGMYNLDGTLTISGSTVSGNSALDRGGGMLNFGTLKITGSTISGNSAHRGGGVLNDGTDLSDPETTITNTTVSGNTATERGGGVFNLLGLTSIEHSTITDNTAPETWASGVDSNGNFATRTEVLSSIISGNTNTDVDSFDDGSTNSFDSKGYNLIGDGNATSAFGQSGDQSGVGDPKLGALAGNGGPTKTHTLLAGSPATDAIPQGTNGCGTTFTEDQRGAARPQGSRCDIGAFELDSTSPTVTINQAAGQADPAKGSPISFTAVFSKRVTGFDSADVTLGGTAGATTANVSGGPTTFTIAVSGMTGDGTVVASIPATVATYAAGNGNTASESTDNTVTFVANRPPTAVADSYTLNEDDTLDVAEPGVLGNDTDPGDALGAVLVSGPGHDASFKLNADGSFDYTPSANYNGPDSFSYKARDASNAESSPVTVSLKVNAVNDAPTLAVSGGQCLSDTKASGTLNFTIADVDSPLSGLNLSATSSDRSLIPDANLVTGGSGADRALTLNAMPKKSGTAAITVSVSDGTDTTTLPVTLRVGTPASETITGDAGTDAIFGLGGRGILDGAGGPDLVCGGNGDDRISGGDGNDVLDGGRGDDLLNGEDGDDRLLGNAGADTLTGDLGADFFSGGSGADTPTDFDAGEGDTKDGT